MKKFGLKAEEWMVELLDRNGTEVRRATRAEDEKFKIDFWVRHDGSWLPIQFSVNRKAILNGKGMDSLQRGIIPMWMSGTELEVAFRNGNGQELVKEFLARVEKILQNFPAVKKFRKPHWTRRTLNNR